jgi:hypothetical protein
MSPKVFCIGFQKTGTKSLAFALSALGYTVTGPNGVMDPRIRENVHTLVRKLVPRFDAFQDNPWPVLYRELDDEYPGSRFVLSVRSSDAWIKSVVGHFGSFETPMRQWVYGAGCPKGNEAIYLRRYEAHNAAALAHFEHRPNDLLVMDIAAGDGWEKLCPFLGKTAPPVPFPHANSLGDRKKMQQQLGL